MKKLDIKDFEEYLTFAKSDAGLTTENFNPECRVEIGKLLISSGYLGAILPGLAVANMMGGIESVLLSLWLTAFQMGREFESRLRDQSEMEKIFKCQD